MNNKRVNMNSQQGENPFKGLYSYQEEEKDILAFHGRERESVELFNLVKLNRLTVVFGKSGIGKTSVLHAGLFPRLRDTFLPIELRLNYSQESDPLLVQVMQRIRKELVFHGISEMVKGRKESSDSLGESETLWEYFHRVEHVNRFGNLVTPVLTFDQFEEFFILGKNHTDRSLLVDELYYLVEDQVPDSLRKKFLTDGEIFPHINTAFAVRVVLVLREDYLPYLNHLKKRIPSVDRVLFHVSHLNGTQARKAINIPGGFAEEEIQKDILSQFFPKDLLPGETLPEDKMEVEPSLLSILCYQMKEKGITSLSGQERDKILSDFYDNVLEELLCSEELAKFIETRLLTEGGFRTPEYFHPENPLREAVEEAVKRRILRKVYYGGKEHVEIIHDVLTPVIKERRNRREEEKRKREIQEELARKRWINRSIIISGIILFLLTIYAFDQKAQKNEQYKVAVSSKLAVQAGIELQKDNIKSIRIAEAAYRIGMPYPSPSVYQVLSAVAFSTLEHPFCTIIMLHEDKVISVVYSPDGTKILSVSRDWAVKLWDLKGNLIALLNKHTDDVNSAVFSPDGTRIVTASDDNTTKLWDLKGNVLTNITKHTDDVKCAVFSPDSTKILTASRDKTAKLWDLEGNLLADLNRHSAQVSSAVFSHDGNKILTVSWDNTAKLWDLEGNLIGDITSYAGDLKSAVFSPDGKKLLTASWDNTVKLWDIRGNLLLTLKHSENVREITFSPDGSTILSRLKNSMILWNLDGNRLADLNKYAEEVVSTVFSGDSKKILTCSGNSAKLWDVKGNLQADLKHANHVSSAVFSPDGSNILTGSWDKTVKLWDLKNNPVADLSTYPGGLNNAVISPDGTRALCWQGNIAKLWDIQGDFIIEMDKHESFILEATFSPNGNMILTRTWVGTAKLWDLDGNLLAHLNDPTVKIISTAFSPNSNEILTASPDNTVKAWDLKGSFLSDLNMNMGLGNVNIDHVILSPDASKILTWWENSVKLWDWNGKLLADLNNHTDKVTDVVFSPDGKKIITSSSDGTAKLWDLKGNFLANLNSHTDEVLNAVFSSDGKRILTASKDNTAKLWDLEGNLLADLDKHTDDVLDAVFSSDGKRIITVSKDGTVKSWLTPEAIIEWLKTALIPRLPEEEIKKLGIDEFDID